MPDAKDFTSEMGVTKSPDSIFTEINMVTVPSPADAIPTVRYPSDGTNDWDRDGRDNCEEYISSTVPRGSFYRLNVALVE